MTMKAGDTSPGPLKQLLDRDKAPADITGAEVVMQVRGRPGQSFPVDIIDAAVGTVRVPRGDLVPSNGRRWEAFDVEFEVTYADGVVQTFPEGPPDTLFVYADLDAV